MSTSPDARPLRADDEIVSLLSEWLAFHVSNADLRDRLGEVGTGELSPEQAEAVEELVSELELDLAARHGDLEMLVRETLEAVALG